MSNYIWSYSTPGVVMTDYPEGSILIPLDISNPQFVVFADWLLKGGVVGVAEAPSWWPFSPPDNTIPYTTEELEKAISDANLEYEEI